MAPPDDPPCPTDPPDPPVAGIGVAESCPPREPAGHPLHAGHRLRLRRRFLQTGLEAFEDHQVLELLLFQVLPRRDTNQIAHLLLRRFGSLSATLEADPADMALVPGMGEHSATFLALIPHVTRRYLHDRVLREKHPLNHADHAKSYAIALLVGRTEEAFYVICLNSRCQVLFPALIARGTVREAYVHPRQVVETVLRHKAAGVILAHNHPAGSLKPSPEDIRLTRSLFQALIPIGVRVLDHLIVAEEECLSMSESGLFDQLWDDRLLGLPGQPGSFPHLAAETIGYPNSPEYLP